MAFTRIAFLLHLGFLLGALNGSAKLHLGSVSRGPREVSPDFEVESQHSEFESARRQLATEFTDKQTVLLGNGDTIDVSYLLTADSLVIKLETTVNTVVGGWVGFGISEYKTGSMKGADIVTTYIDFDGVPVAEDRHLGWVSFPMSPENTYPGLDEQQDWSVVDASETGGKLSVTLTRLIDTGDVEADRVVDINGENRIIVAKGLGRGVSYHSSSRAASVIDFSKVLPTPGIQLPADADGFEEIKMNNYGGFSKAVTTYACRQHIFDTTVPRDIVAFEPILVKENLKLLHHMVIYNCQTEFQSVVDEAKDSCYEIEDLTGASCSAIEYAWAVGGGNLIFPLNTGLRIGNEPGQLHHVLLEFHYDNPNLVSTTDNSGLRIHYTNTLREFETAVLTLGDPTVAFPALPKGDQCITRRGFCRSSCTDKFSQPVHAYMNMHHMHARGRQAFTRLNGELVSKLDYWDFAFQNFNPINYEINPGDVLETSCNYDTTLDDHDVNFALASSDEMCMDFVYYYPRQPDGINCGYFSGFDPFNAICGLDVDLNEQDPTGGDLLDSDFLKSESVCSSSIATEAPTTNAGATPAPVPTPDDSFTGKLNVLLGSGDSIDVSYLLDGEFLVLKLETTVDERIGGWVGFGIAENRTGSMKGADIVTTYVANSGNVVVEDRHLGWVSYPMTAENTFPSRDVQQDWIAVEGSEENGFLSVTIKRKLDTGDKEADRVISTKYENRFIVAKGLGHAVSYHASNRGSGNIDFSKPVPPSEIQLPDDVDGFEIISMNNYGGFKNEVTTYACRQHIFNTSTPKDIVAFEPLLDPVTLKYLHHMVIYQCVKPHKVIIDETKDSCQELTSESGAVCRSIVYAWAVGGGNLIFPNDVGLRIGDDQGQLHHIVLEFHYDNPNLDTAIDNSGLKIYYTETLRPNEAYVLTLGDPSVTFQSLPQQTQCLSRRGYCRPECTGQFTHEITAFMSMHHMHARGRQAYTRLNGEVVSRVDFWDFAFQNFKPVNYKIKPGDTLETVCNYDTALDTKPVNFALGSLDEMCQDFVYYYPKTPQGINCGFYDQVEGFNSLCGLQPTQTTQNQFDGDFLETPFLTSESVCVDSVVLPPSTDAPNPSPSGPPSNAVANSISVLLLVISVVATLHQMMFV